MNTLSLEHATRQVLGEARTGHDDVAGISKRTLAIPRPMLVLFAEVALAVASYALAVYTLADGRGFLWTLGVLRSTAGFLVLARLATLFTVGLYRRSLRYASVADLLTIGKAVSASTIVFGVLVWFQFPALKIPTAVFVVDWAFLQLLWGGLHFGVRVFKTQQAVWRKTGKRVIIVGAGDAGMALLKELALDATSECLPVALVDDDQEKWGRTIYGVPVVGGTMQLSRIAAEWKAEEILICIPSATPAQMRNILGARREASIPVRTLPSLAELMGGKVSRRDLRSPRIEDLLERDGIRIDEAETRKVVGGKVVLVTGAGGSIGSELCLQIAAAGPRMLLLLDKAENSLFYIHREVSERLGAERVKPLLADLLYKERVREILRLERPDIIFHAAAHKHVGLLELHPEEAIRNNVMGTRNIAEAATEFGARAFVNISTDKAVNPSNYMGLSKKLTELCVQELSRNSRTRFMNVRFGNVAGSSGSVLRLFWEQIQKGGPVRVTDPRATRFFMSVPEAVHLILRAAALGKGGETFVFDMGEAINIYELAKTMTLFAGYRPERDLSIEFIGLSEGEKITEELWEEWEHPARTETEHILMIAEQNPHSRGILEKIRRMESFLASGDREGLLRCLREIAPGFKWKQQNASAPHPAHAPEMAAVALPGAA